MSDEIKFQTAPPEDAPAADPEKRSRPLMLKLRPSEYETILAAAEKAGIPISIYIRAAALKAAEEGK